MDIKNIRKKILILILPFSSFLVIAGSKFQNYTILNKSYELLFILLLIYIVLKKFKVSSNIFFLFGIFFLLLSSLLFVFNLDSHTAYSTNIALIYFMIGAINIFVQNLIIRVQDSFESEKKILFIANAIVGEDPGVSGGESRFIELGKQWSDKGYEIHLLAAESGQKLCNKMGLKVVPHVLSKSTKDTRFVQLFIYRYYPRSLKLGLFIPHQSKFTM